MTAPNRKDLTGKVFGSLTVLEYSHTEKVGKTTYVLYRCKCVCGKEKIIRGFYLTHGDAKSCGCGKGKGSTRLANRLPSGDSLFNRVFEHYVNGAKSRNLSFELSREFVRYIISLDCFYCGTPPSNKLNHKGLVGELVYNGIDRIDNSRGYTEDNVVPCCVTCNRAKNKMGYSEFKNWIQKISDFMGAKEIRYAR